MTPRLRNEDRLAVDLLLDRAVTGAGNGSGNGHGHAKGFTPVTGAVHERVGAVEKVLHVLDMFPVDDPPADLAARTMRRVDGESAQDSSALRPPVADGTMQMPHA